MTQAVAVFQLAGHSSIKEFKSPVSPPTGQNGSGINKKPTDGSLNWETF